MSITAKNKNGHKAVKTTKKAKKVISKKALLVNGKAKKEVKKNRKINKVIKANGIKKASKDDHHHHHIMPAHVIVKKRRGEVLSEAEIKYFIDGLAKGTLPEYQMSALAMAVCF
jgi:hypothetical protein